MQYQITAIIFDLGNVLLKWDVYRLYKRFFPDPKAVDSFLQEVRFFEWNAQQDAGRSFKEGVAVLSAEFPQYAELIQAYDTYWEDCVTETIDGTIQIARELKNAGWPLYILSNFSLEKFSLVHSRYDFLNIFDDLIISGEHKLVKPDPSIYEYTLQRINREAGECLFIDDSLPNIEAARMLGFRTIHFRSPEQLDMDLKNILHTQSVYGN
ncbi:MAG: HAD family phosphatase [Anaerolineales bacterium]|nr:HAD family phosphatase [Anaerolineales bacterium]